MTSVVLSPLRKQGDISRIPAAPPAMLLQGSGAPPTATLSRTQGSSTSPAATLACTQGSDTPLPDTLAHSYTPHCTSGSSPCIYKREVQGLPEGGGLPEGKGAPWSIAQRLPDSCGRPRFAPGTCGTGRLRPQIAPATSTTVATVEPASTRGCAEATIPGAEGATTVRRFGVPCPNHQVRKPSARPYNGRRSRPGSGPRLPSPSTRGKQGQSCGLRTTGWHASWEERTTTISSSATSPLFLSDAA
jgi:hypothetical protein